MPAEQPTCWACGQRHPEAFDCGRKTLAAQCRRAVLDAKSGCHGGFRSNAVALTELLTEIAERLERTERVVGNVLIVEVIQRLTSLEKRVDELEVSDTAHGEKESVQIEDLRRRIEQLDLGRTLPGLSVIGHKRLTCPCGSSSWKNAEDLDDMICGNCGGPIGKAIDAVVNCELPPRPGRCFKCAVPVDKPGQLCQDCLIEKEIP